MDRQGPQPVADVLDDLVRPLWELRSLPPACTPQIESM